MLNEKLNLVPHKPGVYKMKDVNGLIIYVGKAKDLRKRLANYFNNPDRLNGKTKKLVSNIVDFEIIITNSELEAFILELNLIKQYNPKYNILLKDDKSYPYIELIRKPYPKLKVTRYLKLKKNNDKLLFGPYKNSYAARRIVNLINRLYPLKKCNNGKNLCLYYHINECLGYCENKIDNQKIIDMENEIISFLKGNEKIIKNKIISKINIYSESLNYELAKDLKQELEFMEIILSKQRVEIHDLINRDFINYFQEDNYVSLEMFFIRNGKLIGNHQHIFNNIGNIVEEIENYLGMFYHKHEIPKEIIVANNINCELLSKLLNTKVYSPIKGNKKQILDMVYNNAKNNLINNLNIIKEKESKTIEVNEELKNLLNLDNLTRIDAFDNSNLFGTFSVSAMIVYRNGVPSKKDYRKYKIMIDKNNDYDMMKEVIYRRYQRCLVEQSELPDLIIVDGGIIQINACKEVLQSLNLNIKICGLKKDTKHNTNNLIDGDTLKIIEIEKHSNLFNYLMAIQNEVHRFTINYHRAIRSKGSITSILEMVPGLGPKRRKKLILKYQNIKNILNASEEELSKIIPQKLILDLKSYLKTIDFK